MEIRRATFGAAVRLGFVLSTIAAILVVIIDSIGDVDPVAMVVTVAAVCFVTSWTLTGRVAHAIPVASGHRVAVLQRRQPVG